MGELRVREYNLFSPTIVMTGATSGIGLHAVKNLVDQTNARILIGARSNSIPTNGYLSLPLDLASLDSVRKFAQEVINSIGEEKIDVLILNAGMQTPTNEKRSVDGYAMAFAVNHLAHYLLIRLLMPYLTQNGRLIITTSDTHDPEVTPMAPKSLEPQKQANPVKGGFGSGMRAYAASKLCNIMTALYLVDSEMVKEKNISVIAFNPGLTSTSLGRESPMLAKIIMRILMHTVFRIIGIFRHEYNLSQPKVPGKALADIALGKLNPPEGQIYISMVKGKHKFLNPSKLAQNKELQKQLWQESEAMVNL